MHMANPHKVGLTVGALIGGWHVFWAILVASGIAQALYDFVLWAHMIHLNIVIGPFDAVAACTLVVVTAVFGYVIGSIGARVWNRMHA